MAITFYVYLGLLFSLCGIVAVVHWQDVKAGWRRLLELPPLQRTAIALLGNWIVNEAFISVTGVHDPALFFIGTDALAAWLVVYQPAGRTQAAIGCVYIVQIIMHVVYLLSDSRFAENPYWWVLISLALVQLIIFGGWTIDVCGGKLVRDRLRRWRPRPALADGP